MHVEFRRNDNAIRARYATDASSPSPKAGIQAEAFQNREAGRPIGIADYIIVLLTYVRLSARFYCPFYLLAPENRYVIYDCNIITRLQLFSKYIYRISCKIPINYLINLAAFCISFDFRQLFTLEREKAQDTSE